MGRCGPKALASRFGDGVLSIPSRGSGPDPRLYSAMRDTLSGNGTPDTTQQQHPARSKILTIHDALKHPDLCQKSHSPNRDFPALPGPIRGLPQAPCVAPPLRSQASTWQIGPRTRWAPFPGTPAATAPLGHIMRLSNTSAVARSGTSLTTEDFLPNSSASPQKSGEMARPNTCESLENTHRWALCQPPRVAPLEVESSEPLGARLPSNGFMALASFSCPPTGN
jgi:hypothetical protein